MSEITMVPFYTPRSKSWTYTKYPRHPGCVQRKMLSRSVQVREVTVQPLSCTSQPSISCDREYLLYSIDHFVTNRMRRAATAALTAADAANTCASICLYITTMTVHTKAIPDTVQNGFMTQVTD